MRAVVLLVVAVLGAIGIALGALAASSDTASVTLATIEPSFSSLGARPDLELAFGLSSSSDPSLQLGYVIEESSDTPGVPLEHAGSKVGTAVFVFLDRVQLLDLYVLDGRELYAKVDFLALSPFVSSRSGRSELGGLQASYGGNWYRLPKLAASAHVPGRGSSSEASAAQSLLSTMKNVLKDDTSPSVVVGPHGYNGVAVSGSTGELLGALWPALSRFEQAIGERLPFADLPGADLGSFSVSFFVDRTNELREITARLGLVPLGIGIVVNHNPIAIVTPPSPSPLPNALKRRALALLKAVEILHPSLA
jgi:hypothetical protein